MTHNHEWRGTMHVPFVGKDMTVLPTIAGAPIDAINILILPHRSTAISPAYGRNGWERRTVAHHAPLMHGAVPWPPPAVGEDLNALTNVMAVSSRAFNVLPQGSSRIIRTPPNRDDIACAEH